MEENDDSLSSMTCNRKDKRICAVIRAAVTLSIGDPSCVGYLYVGAVLIEAEEVPQVLLGKIYSIYKTLCCAAQVHPATFTPATIHHRVARRS